MKKLGQREILTVFKELNTAYMSALDAPTSTATASSSSMSSPALREPSSMPPSGTVSILDEGSRHFYWLIRFLFCLCSSLESMQDCTVGFGKLNLIKSLKGTFANFAENYSNHQISIVNCNCQGPRVNALMWSSFLLS